MFSSDLDWSSMVNRSVAVTSVRVACLINQ